MLDGFVGDVLVCMDDEHGMPVVEPVCAGDLPDIVLRILSPDQRKGYIVFSEEVLKYAADAELVLKYRYHDFSAFMEELLWVLSQVGDVQDRSLWHLAIKDALRNWFEEELDNSAQFKFDFRFDLP